MTTANSTRSAHLPATPQAPGRARRVLAAAITGRAELGSLQLATSEVVTNVVRHAGLEPHDEIELRVELRGARVRVTVLHAGRGLDLDRAPPGRAGREDGWGLAIVRAVTAAWGVTTDAGRSAVWIEV